MVLLLELHLLCHLVWQVLSIQVSLDLLMAFHLVLLAPIVQVTLVLFRACDRGLQAMNLMVLLFLEQV